MTTRQTLQRLRDYESRNVTFMEPDGSWPIVWKRAQGVYVWDAEGKRYLDLTAAFGVAAAGHANPKVVKAGQDQMAVLLHAMGDVHPHELKADLARELSRVTFERWGGKDSDTHGKTIFCNSGFEAVEAALKTARLATGKPGVISFTSAYHGLGYGALNATDRRHFRGPFEDQLGGFGCPIPFPVNWEEADKNFRELKTVERHLRATFQRLKIGAILVEPIQVRGGINIPPPGFLALLRRVADEHKAVLILDEIYTGFGRTGKWFACEHERVAPDVICLGKALTGGFPLSACVGRADLMDAAWPPSEGEAIHTSTFLGHPVGCAMALAQLREIRSRSLVENSARLGAVLLRLLKRAVHTLPDAPRFRVRGKGLLAGVEILKNDGSPDTQRALAAMKAMLHQGYILLPEGEHANILSLSPPLIITQVQLARAIKKLQSVL